jgi:hypothetical protein
MQGLFSSNFKLIPNRNISSEILNIMKFTRKLHFVLISLLLVLGGCIPGITRRAAPDPFAQWIADQILYLSPPDASSPDQDLIALYFHSDRKHFTWRFDFLQMKDKPAFDLYFLIDYKAGGSQDLPSQLISDLSWDYGARIQPDGEIYLRDAEGKEISTQKVSAAIDADLESIILNLNASLLKKAVDPIRVQAYLADSTTGELVDQSPVLTLVPLSPPPQASVLLSFTDVLPAYTPAQALRYWDGAHSGPFGGRHGLKLLLDSADRYHVPLVLLDLKTPASLSALDYLGQTQTLVDLEQKGLVSLPDAAIGDPLVEDTSLSYSHRFAGNFGYASSQAAYVPVLTSAPSGYEMVFSSLGTNIGVQYANRQRYISVQQEFGFGSEDDTQNLQATADGLSLEIKKALLQNAISAQPGAYLSLGGSLKRSPWGDSMIAPLIFRYLAYHPWINALRAEDFSSMHAAVNENLVQNPPTDLYPNGPEYADLRSALQSLPPGTLTDSTWLAYLNLTRQTNDAEFQQLQLNYLDIVRDLAQSAKWAASPTDISTCDQRHCILATDRYFASIELQAGVLSLLVHKDSTGATEWIGSSAQFIVGMSDPSQWQLDDGLFSDPLTVPGAFLDTRNAPVFYQPYLQGQQIALTSQEEKIKKKFSIAGSDFQVICESSAGVQATIPVIFLPGMRFSPQWQQSFTFQALEDATSWKVSSENDSGFSITTNIPALQRLETFKDTFPLMTTPEDPNQEYSSGHYLPFPMAELTLVSSGSDPLVITFSPNK